MATSSTETPQERVAKVVRAAVAAKGLSSPSLSLATGISRQTLDRRLSGKSPFNIDELARIASAIGCTADTFTAVLADAA